MIFYTVIITVICLIICLSLLLIDTYINYKLTDGLRSDIRIMLKKIYSSNSECSCLDFTILNDGTFSVVHLNTFEKYKLFFQLLSKESKITTKIEQEFLNLQ